MSDPIALAALLVAVFAALAALVAALRSGRTSPADPTSTLQAQRVEDQLQSVVERLARIDAAQQGIDRLREPMDELLSVFQNKQARGQYGEARLEEIVRDALQTNPQAAPSLAAVITNRVLQVQCHPAARRPPPCLR